MKRLMILFIFTLLYSPIIATAGDVFANDVYEVACYNGTIDDMGYNHRDKELFFVVVPSDASNISYGMAVFAMKFNESRAPDYKEVKGVSINDQSAADMVINYSFYEATYSPGEFEPDIPCMYLEVYFYLFENHTVINEQPIDVRMRPSGISDAGTILYIGGASEIGLAIPLHVIAIGIMAVVCIVVVVMRKRFLQQH